MTSDNNSPDITSVEQLRALYGQPKSTSLQKQTDQLNATYVLWLEQSSFFVLASVGKDGIDCTPRGDAPGAAFKVIDNKTIVIPDRRGNNRLDSLTNIVHDPRIALLFFIPGVDQSLRIIGNATVTTDQQLLNRFTLEDKNPVTCIRISIEAVYFQNARAMSRSKLWKPANSLMPSVPTPGEMIQSVNPEFDPESYDAG